MIITLQEWIKSWAQKSQKVLVRWTNQRLIPERTRRRLDGCGNDPSAARPHELSEPQSESFTESFNRLPGPFGQGRLVACVSVARVRPRTSK
eukprot:gene15079-31985_t